MDAIDYYIRQLPPPSVRPSVRSSVRVDRPTDRPTDRPSAASVRVRLSVRRHLS